MTAYCAVCRVLAPIAAVIPVALSDYTAARYRKVGARQTYVTLTCGHTLKVVSPL